MLDSLNERNIYIILIKSVTENSSFSEEKGVLEITVFLNLGLRCLDLSEPNCLTDFSLSEISDVCREDERFFY